MNWSPFVDLLKINKKHRWFSSPTNDGDERWYGPHETIQDALLEVVCLDDFCGVVYVTSGYKMTKRELEEYGNPDYDWQVKSSNALKIRWTKK